MRVTDLSPLGFLPLAKSMGVTVHAADGGFFSFFNSPYYSHVHMSAVDIYQTGSGSEISALSPVDGILTKIYEFKSPRPRHFKAPEVEQLLLINPKEDPSLYVRFLHIDCPLKDGASISVGDCLGTLIRSGFFNFWTSKHIHVEIRPLKEPLRAKGGYPLEPVNSDQDMAGHPVDEVPAMRAVEVSEDYVLVEPEEGMARFGRFWGLGCKIKDVPGILDCGIPHYCHGGVHMMDTSAVNVGDGVNLWGIAVGQVTQVFRNMVHFKCRPMSIYFNEQPIRGLSIYPHLGESRTIKIIPQRPRAFMNTNVGEKISLRLISVPTR